eukprot:1361372-Pyramimonas_sp.AAC.1
MHTSERMVWESARASPKPTPRGAGGGSEDKGKRLSLRAYSPREKSCKWSGAATSTTGCGPAPWTQRASCAPKSSARGAPR